MNIFKKIFKRDKEKFIIPKGVQDTIPIKRIYEDLQNNKINSKNIEAMATLQKINMALLNDRPL